MLFNIYVHDLPPTLAKKYRYADDLAILLSDKLWETIEEDLTADMSTLSTYLKNWCLKLSVAKTMSSSFHLNNREARRELKVMVNGNPLQFKAILTCLGVKLDRTLTFRQHLEKMSAKTTSRVSLIRLLTGTTWGAATKTLCISSQALVFSTAEYCAPVWCRSPHTKKQDVVLNNSLRTVSGSLRATPVNHLPILSGIAPAALCREAEVLALTCKVECDADHLLHKTVCEPPQHARLKFCHAFIRHAHQLLRDLPPDTSKQTWIRHRWYEEWRGVVNHSRLHKFIKLPNEILGTELLRRQWTTLNRLRSGVSRFASSMKECRLKDSAECECGHPEQTVHHIIEDCLLYRPPNGEQGLVALDGDTRSWLASTELEI